MNHPATLSRGRSDPMNRFRFNCSNLVTECNINDQRFGDGAGILKGPSLSQTSCSSGFNHFSGELSPVAGDYFGGVYEYIKHMLMEEDDLDHRPCMFQDCSALQAAEKYFHDALSDKASPRHLPSGNISPSLVDNRHAVVADEDIPHLMNRSASGFADWSCFHSQFGGEDFLTDGLSAFPCDLDVETHFQVHNSTTPSTRPIQENSNQENDGNAIDFPIPAEDEMLNEVVTAGDGRGGKENFPGESSRKRNDDRGGNNVEYLENRSNKHVAVTYVEELELMEEKYDKSLLCRKMNPGFYEESPTCGYEEILSDEEDLKMRQYRKSTAVKRGRPKGSKKGAQVKEVVDLRCLLTRCAQAVSSFDNSTADETLKQIRQHSSPFGDANERLAHCFANALEARMAGTGSALYTATATRRTLAAELLKSYQTYVTACPFKRMSNIFANKSIGSHVKDADRIHIIDFGILYGFQWPCIIQGLSLRPGGPPRLKITGIDFPQPGFKPAERIEQTGRRLMAYCKRFNVPFEYHAIAKRWDEICVEDLNIEREETLVVNCLYRLRHVPDESAGMNSPRDAVLKLIKKLNPNLFVHGVVNGTYNASFFGTRFREALYHYSSFFDMMEATIPREDSDRSLHEREVFGRDILNVIACEGYERVERPETYKKWQVRNQRAGFRVLPLNREIFEEVKIKVMRGYHNDFLVDEDSGWMLQGWKGRVMYALSCWKPSEQGINRNNRMDLCSNVAVVT